MRTLLYRAFAALYTAAAMIGLFVVAGAPLTLHEEIVAALASGIAVEVYIEWYVRRRRTRMT